METLQTVESVIDAVGGIVAASQIADVGKTAVTNWKWRNKIPPEYYMIFAKELEQRGKEANPDVFGFVSEITSA